MKRVALAFMLLFLGYTLFSSGTEAIATLELMTTISVTDVTIDMYYDDGTKEETSSGSLEFVLPSDQDSWEVEESVYFRYSSNLAEQKRGSLTFSVTPLQMDSDNVLDTSIELESEDLMTLVRDETTFNIGFLDGPQEDVDIGELTVVVSKGSSDVLVAGLYTGSITITYTSES
jgi:hypothetical protein